MLAAALGGFVLLVAYGRRLGEPLAGWVGTAAIGVAFVVAVITWIGLLGHGNREITENLFDWLPIGRLQVKVSLLVDPLSVTMCLFITGVSALIHLYSVGYMHRERDFTKFFVYLNLFVFSMLLLVLADNLLVTFVGWEGVGVCSYWLVAFYFDRDSAASAGKKAFIYNRIGDVGMLVAMFVLFTHLHTLTYLGINAGVSTLTGDRSRSSSSRSCWPPRASQHRSRCLTGCPTRWRARRRCRPSSTPRRW